MATIYATDREQLENVVINVLTKNVPRLVALLKEMALEIDIGDERKLQADLRELLSIIDTNTLSSIDVVGLFERFKPLLFENRVVMPDYFLLLGRGLMLIESIGRTLNPDLNVVRSIEPYMWHVLRRRLNGPYLLGKLGRWAQDFANLPFELRSIVQQLEAGQLTIQTEPRQPDYMQRLVKRGFATLALSLALCGNLIAAALLFGAGQTQPAAYTLALCGLIGFALFRLVR